MSAVASNRNRRLGGALVLVVAGMVGAAYAAVPLYDLFCRVTGYGGTTQVADAAPEAAIDRVITVRFNSDVQSRLPWTFRPEQTEMPVRVGESALAFYRARNDSDQAQVGTATFNVTPQKAGAYFSKIECFCFTEQVLQPGQTVDMPVTFFVDPAIAADSDMDDVTTITLSYMFFNAGEDARERVLGQADDDPAPAGGPAATDRRSGAQL